MENLNDLKAIWLTAKTDTLPNSAEMMLLIKKFRDTKLRKKIIMITTASVLMALMIVLLFIYNANKPTTRIGEALIIIAAGILVISNIRSVKRFYDFVDYSNKDYIKFLEQTRINRIHYYKRTQVIAMLCCSVGLLLYLYEIVYKNTVVFIAAYSFVLVYILVLWLIVRPRIFKREEKKLNATIERLEMLSKQL